MNANRCPACGAANEIDAEDCLACAAPLPAAGVGKVVGERYELVRLLGRGGMGLVYEARDRMLEETVALKVLRYDRTATSENERRGVARRFVSEIKLARKVRHRNVCGIHEYGQDGRLCYIVMELIAGEDLRQVVRRRGPLPWAEVYEISIQVGEGLQAIHEAGIVHRDLKTANIMQGADGRVRLMDFGIAKSWEANTVDAITGTGQIIGTPEYMSPEQCQGERLDARSDVYSLGVVIYELCAGQVPFRANTPVGTILKHIQEPPPLDSHLVPPALAAVLERALAKRREDRQASAAALVDELREARDAETPQVATRRREATPPETPRPIPAVAVAPRPDPVTVVETASGTPHPATGGHATLWWLLGGAFTAVFAGALAGGLLLGSATTPGAAASPPPMSLVGTDPAAGPSRAPAVRDPEPQASMAAERPPTPSASHSPVVGTPPAPATPEPRVSAQPRVATGPDPRVAATSDPPASREADPGWLQVVAEPWAEVSIDGVSAGMTPLRKVSLPPGRRVVRLQNPEFEAWQRVVSIRSGETTTLKFDFRWEGVPKTSP